MAIERERVERETATKNETREQCTFALSVQIQNNFKALCLCVCICVWSSNRWQQNWREMLIYLMGLLFVYVCARERLHHFQLKSWFLSSSSLLCLSVSCFFGFESNIDFYVWHALTTSYESTFRARASSITYIFYNMLHCIGLSFHHYVRVCTSKSKPCARVQPASNRPIESVNLAEMKCESASRQCLHINIANLQPVRNLDLTSKQSKHLPPFKGKQQDAPLCTPSIHSNDRSIDRLIVFN